MDGRNFFLVLGGKNMSNKTMPAWLSAKVGQLPLAWIEQRVVEGECGCWLWAGSVNKGRLTAILTWGRGRQHAFDARRLVYRLAHGRFAPSHLSPRCPHHAHCVHPDHLVLVPLSPVHASSALWRAAISQGRKKASAIMDEDKAAHIRSSTEPLRVVAQQVGCSVSMASLIRRGLIWAAPTPWAGLL